MKLRIVTLLMVFVFVAMSREWVVAEDAAPAAAPAAEEVVLNGDVAKGEVTYKQYCALCHGDTGDGDGAGAVALDPKPRKFSDKALMDTIPDKEIFQVIKEGGQSIGKSMFMVAWKAVLTDEQIKDVGTYVRTLAK
jgi:mono/diheme cytochrome c family protein